MRRRRRRLGGTLLVKDFARGRRFMRRPLHKPSEVNCEYVGGAARWIDFPWSAIEPVTASAVTRGDAVL
jgi:hypothetical protein